MLDRIKLHELALKIDMPYDKLRERIEELLANACDPEAPIESKLESCFLLEPYSIFPQDVIVGAPTSRVYEAYILDIYKELGKERQYKPKDQRQLSSDSELMTLDQALALMDSGS